MYKATLALLAIAQTALSAPILARQDANPCGAPTGSGVCIKNAASHDQTFSFYQNIGDGNGFAYPSADPLADKDTVVPAGSATFVPLDMSFKGRIQRTKLHVTVWAEFQLEDTLTDNHTPDHKAHGDISLIQGYDGAVEIASLDGTGQHSGFNTDLLAAGNTDGLTVTREDGSIALANTDTSFYDPSIAGNAGTAAYEVGLIGNSAYTAPYSGVPDVSSANNQLLFTFY